VPGVRTREQPLRKVPNEEKLHWILLERDINNYCFKRLGLGIGIFTAYLDKYGGLNK
jgi:hypothetical protein